jgi:hypothetical protein
VTREVVGDIVFSCTASLWGGKKRLLVHCSGFTQMVYKQWVQIIRDASQQATQGFIEESDQVIWLF